MAIWTNPITWAASVYGASDLNAQIRDNLNYLRFVTAYQTEDALINTSTAFEDLPGLKFYGQPGETWVFSGQLFWVSNATADAKWTITAPTKVISSSIFGMGHSLPITAAWSTVPGTGIAGASTTTIEDSFSISGLVTFGLRGAVQVQGSQNTSTAVNTIFYDFGYLTAWRLN